MSRIHEALRRAEQEKIAGAPSAGMPVVEQEDSPSALTESPETSHLGSAVAAAAPVVPLADPDTAHSLHTEVLQQCRQTTWKPGASMLFFEERPNSSFGVEGFRSLRSRLYRIRERERTKTILIGSAVPGEGKTYVSANLAQVLALRHGRRTLLIDGDLRNPRLHECLGTAPAAGLTEYLRGTVDEFGAIQRGPMPGLYFMSGGETASNPADLLASGRMKHLLEKVSPLFDWIIVDSSPVVLVSDAVLLAGNCDGVLLVIDSGRTPADVTEKAVEEFRGAPILGVVLNRVERRNSYERYGYYSGFDGQVYGEKSVTKRR